MNPRPYMEIVEPLPKLRFPRSMTDEEELACQSILHPSIPRNPTQADTIYWHRTQHRNKTIMEARKRTRYCDWSVETHTFEQPAPARRRTLGGLKVFREKDASKQTATQSQTSSVIGSVNVSSSQAVALDANITQTLEDRVITSTWLDNTTDYIVTNQRDKFKEELDEQQAIVQSLDINTTNRSSNNIMDDSMNSFEDDFMNEVNEQKGTTSVTLTSTTH